MGTRMLQKREHAAGRIGIVVAMSREVRTLAPVADDPHYTICCEGVGYDAATMATAKLIDGGCDRILSWGIAGGLSKELRVGSILFPAWVIDAATGIHYESADPQSDGSLLSVREVVRSRDKARWLATCSADAVDMESAAIGRVCHQRGVPFLVCRAISDTISDGWIDTVADVMQPDGRLKWGSLIRKIIVRPHHLIAARRNTNQALSALHAHARTMVAW